MDRGQIAGNVQRVFRARYKMNEPGLVSHITQHAAGREPLFVEDGDYLSLLDLLKESAEQFSLSYYALCLMPNYAHLLLEPQEKNLSEAMRFIFSRYAAKFNRRYQPRGHLFGGPYRQSVCLDETYLLTASVYIHLNPVRVGLTDTPGAYRWSSGAQYSREVSGKSFIDPHPILRLLRRDEPAARRQYNQILQQAQGSETENALEQEGAIEKFCQRLADMFPAVFRRRSERQRKDQGQPSSLLELTRLEQLLQDVEFARPRSPESKKARKFAVEQLLARGYKKTQIASRLGISRRSVYNILYSE